MRNVRTRIGAGIALGIAVAAAVPLLSLAVHDTGDDSGDDPLQLTLHAAIARGASASWSETTPTAEVTYRFSFEQPDHQTAHTQIDENGTRYGWRSEETNDLAEARAVRRECDLAGDDCFEQSWMGFAAQDPREGYVVDPTLSLARFEGYLWGPTSCVFTVEWVARPGLDTDASGGASLEEHVTGASGQAEVGRTADARIDSGCFRVASGEENGTIWADLAGSVRAVADPTEPPNPLPTP